MAFSERFFQNEAMFNSIVKSKDPVSLDESFNGVQHMVVQAINSSDVDIRRELYSNIILTGGTSMMKGFSERLQKSLPDISPASIKVKVSTMSDRRF